MSAFSSFPDLSVLRRVPYGAWLCSTAKDESGNDEHMIPPHEMVIRLLLGAVLGGVIGFEREVHGQAAGFRTQLLVCVAAVLIMIVSENYYFHLLLENPDLLKQDSAFRIDPARIAAGAVIGIGFLGAGAIIKSGFIIRGLTTAASIWI